MAVCLISGLENYLGLNDADSFLEDVEAEAEYVTGIEVEKVEQVEAMIDASTWLGPIRKSYWRNAI